MTLDEYREKIKLYELFALTISNILKEAISQNCSFKVQQIQHRAKTYESLYHRLEEGNLLEHKAIEDLRSDLAGCRVIFYFNDDVSQFLHSNIVPNNFNVDWDNSKLRGRELNPKKANDYYTAIHYTVRLCDTRLQLPEYSAFKGLKCEIQIHTILNHAWSETAHDITYKSAVDSDYGKNKLNEIDSQLKEVMVDYLLPAGHKLQKIKRDHDLLLKGKKLLGRDLSEEITNCEDNNQRYEILENYKNYTLPHFADYHEKLESILDFLSKAIEISDKTSPVEIETPFGPIPGKSSRDILAVSLGIIEYFRCVDLKTVFYFLINTYRSKTDETGKKIVKDTILKLIKYDFDILTKVGFQAQFDILYCLESLEAFQLCSLKELIAEIGKCILSTKIESTSWEDSTCTIPPGCMIGSEQLSTIHSKMLQILYKQYEPTNQESTKKKLITAFKQSSKLPHLANYSDDLLEIILNNYVSTINFFTNLIEFEQYEIISDIEQHICFLYHSALNILGNNNVKSQSCKNICYSIIEKALIFRKNLNAIDEYIIYKTLVGFNTVFEQSWEDETWNIINRSEYIQSQIKFFIERLEREDKSYWEDIIIKCTDAKGVDMATFKAFNIFINELSLKNPEFSLKLIKRNEAKLMPFSWPLLDGLLKSTLRNKMLEIMNLWVDEGKYLEECTVAFIKQSNLDNDLLDKIYQKACIIKDIRALNELVAVSAQKYSNNKRSMKKLFINSIKQLTKMEDTTWRKNIGFIEAYQKIITDLNKVQRNILLKNLIIVNEIDFHFEQIIYPIATQYPQEILDFFKERIKHENKKLKDKTTYEAIPFNFHVLIEAFKKHTDIVFATAISSYTGDQLAFHFQGAKLISNLFSTYTADLNNSLLTLIENGSEHNYCIAISILSYYPCIKSISEVLKKIIINLDIDSPLLNEINNFLLCPKTVFEGDLGWSNHLDKTREIIEKWDTKNNVALEKFRTKIIQLIKNKIISDVQRSEK